MKKIGFLFFGALISFNAFAQQAYDLPFRDPSLSTEKRVDDLISRMTLMQFEYHHRLLN
jgi:hypothetical protein